MVSKKLRVKLSMLSKYVRGYVSVLNETLFFEIVIFSRGTILV